MTKTKQSKTKQSKIKDSLISDGSLKTHLKSTRILSNNQENAESAFSLSYLKDKVKRTEKKDNNSNEKNPFHYESSLNRYQRKYCHCLMGVRDSLESRGKTTKKAKKTIKIKSKSQTKFRQNNPYPICYSTIRRSFKLDKNKKSKAKFHKLLKPKQTNCIMNYDFSKYDYNDVQLLAKEKGIPLHFFKDGKMYYFKKITLVKKMVSKYLNSKKVKKVKKVKSDKK
jgi:hypothetical protein